jgi:hypothetical protein
MALSQLGVDNGKGADVPLDQFEKCEVKDGRECKYCDTNGRCIFETCIMDNEYPPQTLLWYFQCIACKKVDSIRPRDMKIHFCKNCIEQLQKAQVLPFTCILCGKSQAHRSQGFGNQICDECISKLQGYMAKYGTGAHC